MGTYGKSLRAVLAVVAAALTIPATAGAFSAPQIVSGTDAGAKSPALAADSATSRYVVWVRAADHHVVARRSSDDGSLGAVLDLSGESAKAPDLAAVAVADTAGNVTVVWARADDQHVVAVRIPAGGAPQGVVDVTQTSVAASSQNNAGVGGDGVVHIVWRNGSDSHVMTRSLAPDATLSAVTDISVTDGETALWGTAPAVAADGAGNAFFTYHRNSDCHIMLRSLSTGGVVGPAVEVTPTPDKAVGDTSPGVAVAGPNVLVVWHRDGDIFDHADDAVYFSVVAGGVTPGPLTQLSATGDVSMMAIGAAGGPDGSFGVTWQGRVGGAVWHRAISAAGVAAPPGGPLLASGSAADAAPAIAIGPTAGTAVAWTAADGSVSVTSATGSWSPPAARPQLKMVKGSAKIRKGKLQFRVSCAAAACHVAAKFTDRAGKHRWARGKFNVSAGASKLVKLKLSAAARSRLRRTGRLKGTLRLSPDGGAVTRSSLKLRR